MILASASPRRRELLQDLGIDARVMPANCDETRKDGEGALELVERLARGKAEACLHRLEELGETLRETILAADTIVWLDDETVLGKPRSKEDAKRMLRLLSGRTHRVSTGVCLLGTHRRTSFTETTEVEFFPLDESLISAYVESGEPLDKAGSYGIQGLGRLLVKGIRGDYFNVVGLPVARTIRALSQMEGAQAEGALALVSERCKPDGSHE